MLRLPENGSISLILDGLDTLTTVEFHTDRRKSSVTIDGESDEKEAKRVLKQIDRIKSLAVSKQLLQQKEAEDLTVTVASKNTFPKGTGLSSSGSGFAALTYAAADALEMLLSERELSILARRGSGTACRCMSTGIVEWLDGNTSETSYSVSLYPPNYWDIRDVIAVVDTGRKKVSSTEGHQSAQSSPFYQVRLQHISRKIDTVKQALIEKNFVELGELIEAEALEFHSILLTSTPSLIAWYPGTVEVMLAVQMMREEGVPAYFTINTGFNVHVLTLPEYESVVQKKLSELSLVKQTLTAKIGKGPRIENTPLF